MGVKFGMEERTYGDEQTDKQTDKKLNVFGHPGGG